MRLRVSEVGVKYGDRLDPADALSHLPPSIVLYGRDDENRRVVLFVRDVPNEIYVAVPEHYTPGEVEILRDALDAHLARDKPKCVRTGCRFHDPIFASPFECDDDDDDDDDAEDENESDERTKIPPRRIRSDACSETRVHDPHPVVDARLVRARGFVGYERDDRLFVKITLRAAYHAQPTKSFLTRKSTRRAGGSSREFEGAAERFGLLRGPSGGVYEYCDDAVESFMRVADAATYVWYEAAVLSEPTPRVTRAEVEAHCRFSDLRRIDDPANVLVSARALVFDIETISDRPNGVSSPARHPVGMIGARVVDDVDPGRNDSVLFAFGPKFDLPGVRVFDTEIEMFAAFRAYVLSADPDFLVGYNSNYFDMCYLLDRARVIGATDFADLGLMPLQKARGLVIQRSSNGHGTRRTAVFDVPGRACVDLLQVVAEQHRLRSYKLKDVAEELELADGKADMPYSEIYGHFHGDATMRARLGEYCVRDVTVTAQLMSRTCAISNLVGKCQVFRARPTDVMDRTSSPTNARLVRAYSLPAGFLIPAREFGDTEMSGFLGTCPAYVREWQDSTSIEGGFVFDPVPGLYLNVACLDFNSLYPSIVRENNLCHTTMLRVAEEGCWTGPDVLDGKGDHEARFSFVRSRRGVLPTMLERLGAARTAAKKARDAATDKRQYDALDSLQNAYKVCSNAVYGICGTPGELLNRAVAATITACGRKYIRAVHAAVCGTAFREWRAQPTLALTPVYGDTDSLFFCVGDESTSLEDARVVVRSLVVWLNEHSKLYSKPMNIEFEKIFSRLLLRCKKRYAGCAFGPKVEETKPKFMCKGLKNVERTSTPIVSETLDEMLRLMLMRGASPTELATFAHDRLANLAMGAVSVSALTRSATIRKPLNAYAASAPPAHVVAARQMIHAGHDVRPGERVAYVYEAVESSRVCDKVLATIFHRTDKHVLDFRKYFDELAKAFESVLFYVRGIESVFDANRYDFIVRGALRASPFVRDGGTLTRIQRATIQMDAPFVARTASGAVKRDRPARSSDDPDERPDLVPRSDSSGSDESSTATTSPRAGSDARFVAAREKRVRSLREMFSGR
jgi:DNA polymerase delta subunit 1